MTRKLSQCQAECVTAGSAPAAGVPPGLYEVVWVIDAHKANTMYEGPTYNMSAAAEPLGLEPVPAEQSSGSGPAGGAGVGAGAGSSMGSAQAGAGAGASNTTAAGFASTAAGVVEYMGRLRALWLGQAPQASSSSSSGMNAGADSSSGQPVQGAGSSVSVSMVERQMISSLRPTHQWGELSGALT
jgi:hypothetical protein